jgi:hypothetical protein
MLEQARKRSDIEWILGDLASVRWDREFDLVVMSGHAFQVFVKDDDLRVALAAIRAALTDDGRFAFETRNPLVREWERWTPAHANEVTGADGPWCGWLARSSRPSRETWFLSPTPSPVPVGTGRRSAGAL